MKTFDTTPHPRIDVPDLRSRTLTTGLALMPVLAALLWLNGPLLLLHLAAGMAAARGVELLASRWRQPTLKTGRSDNGDLLIALLLGMCLGSQWPLWASVCATLLAVAFGRALYGGPARSPFNAVMIGWGALLLFAPGSALTQAHDPRWLLVSALSLIGGVWLARARLLAWQISASMLAVTLLGLGMLVLATSNQAVTETLASRSFALFVLTTCFIVPDSASSCVTTQGRWLFGAFVSLLMLLTVLAGGTWIAGLVFGTLLSNALAPLLESTRRRPSAQ